MKSYVYDCILRITDDSSHIVRDIRNMVLHMNAPLIYLLWGTMLLVYLDVINQVIGNPVKYSFVVGKTMFEALFYSLFFVLWTELLANTKWRERFRFLQMGINKVKHIPINKNKLLVLSYATFHNLIIFIYTTRLIYTLHCIFTCAIYYYMSSQVCTFIIENTHLYATPLCKNKNMNEKDDINHGVDAIIKWEYSEKPINSSNNWVILDS